MAAKRAGLAELMGKSGSKGSLSLDQLRDILGDAMPELPRSAVGRHRLIRALQQRFGSNFRSLPGISSLVKEFDADIALEHKVAQLKNIRMKGK